tara:strand:- start:20474 stop:20704 length:231 start_codon:yes stop_codon:yes gene_type:complete
MSNTRLPALRIRLDLAIKTDPTDMTAFGTSVGKVHALKAAALEAGFTLTEEMTSRVGTFEFPAAPEAEVKNPQAAE